MGVPIHSDRPSQAILPPITDEEMVRISVELSERIFERSRTSSVASPVKSLPKFAPCSITPQPNHSLREIASVSRYVCTDF